MACKAKTGIASDGGRRGEGTGKKIFPISLAPVRKKLKKYVVVDLMIIEKLACDE